MYTNLPSSPIRTVKGVTNARTSMWSSSIPNLTELIRQMSGNKQLQKAENHWTKHYDWCVKTLSFLVKRPSLQMFLVKQLYILFYQTTKLQGNKVTYSRILTFFVTYILIYKLQKVTNIQRKLDFARFFNKNILSCKKHLLK